MKKLKACNFQPHTKFNVNLVFSGALVGLAMLNKQKEEPGKLVKVLIHRTIFEEPSK